MVEIVSNEKSSHCHSHLFIGPLDTAIPAIPANHVERNPSDKSKGAQSSFQTWKREMEVCPLAQ